ncbi:hypothetical protein AN403_6014 [Pseudomonas fluorescens]|uniref:Uncharacterized protein n=1 Tax=Pseudomonas fluorescens TaxID=294 RepID=A0A0P9BFN6_PSEFL|nr:hypothetical protein AN403_6014 [Pseudomonas fluorescens]
MVALQVASSLGLVTQALYAVHDIVGLRQEGIAQALYPDGILPQRCQNLREGDQRLHARIPGLVRHLFDRIVALGVGVRFGPADRLTNFPGVSGGHQYLCQQGVGVKRNGRQHLIQLFLGEHGILGRRCDGRRIGRACRCRCGRIRTQCQAGISAQKQYGRQRVKQWNVHCTPMWSGRLEMSGSSQAGASRLCKPQSSASAPLPNGSSSFQGPRLALKRRDADPDQCALASLSCSSANAMKTFRSSTSSLIWAMNAENARLAARIRRSEAQAGR